MPIAVQRPDHVLSRGVHAGHEWMTVHNGIGYRCGYVKVGPGHPWHGKGYDDVEAEVHGGLTFAEADEPCANPDGVDDGWWLGFDCAHGWDKPDPSLKPGASGLFPTHGTIKTQEYVESECRALCEQAARAKESR